MSAPAPAPKGGFETRPDVLTVSEVCAWLRIGRNTAGQLLRDGKIHGVRIGSAYRISRASVQRFLDGSEGSES